MNTQRNTIIESLGTYLPEMVVTTQEVVNGCRKRLLFPLEFITGIRARRMAGDGEYSYDLAVKAVERCLARSRHRAEDIDLVISCSISRYDAPECFAFEPGTAVRLRNQFGFNAAVTLDLSNACAGVFTAIYVVDALLRSGAIRRGLVVSGEFITHLTRTAQREIKGFTDPRLACLTLGDSGMAMVLELGADDARGFQKIQIFTLSQFSHYCIAKASDHHGGGAIMLTDVVKLSSVAVDEASRHAVKLQKLFNWSPEQLHHLIMHQTSERTIREAIKKVNEIYGREICSENNTIINVYERGNTATTSHFIAFEEEIQAQRIQPGQNVLFSVNASGLTIGTAVYKCDDLPVRMHNFSKNGGPKPSSDRHGRLVEALVSAPTARIHAVGVVPAGLVVRKETWALCRTAAENCLEQSAHDRSEIDLLIFAGVYRSQYICEPAMAAMIASELNMGMDRDAAHKLFCFDVIDGAAGMLKAAYLASRLIESGQARLAMIGAAEIEPNALLPGKPLLGVEATASALLLEPAKGGNSGFGSFTFRFFPEYEESFRSYCDLSVPGGLLQIQKDPQWQDICTDCIGTAVNEHFAATGVDRGRIACVLAPQMSSEFLGRLGSRLGFADKMINAVESHKDLYTSSFPYAWLRAMENKSTQTGDLALVIAAGSGVQVICCFYHLG